MTTSCTITPATVIEAVADLAPLIAGRADEIEPARRLPRDLVETLRAAGCFRLLRPPSHGGLGATFPDAMRVFEALARADASVGWTVMIGATAWLDLIGLPPSTFASLFGAHPDAITAGSFNPTGSAEAVGDGYRVSGRWGFASGCEHADVVFANCIEGPGDGPAIRTVVLAPEDAVIEDTWFASGLSGTGSHHFHVDGVVVGAERTCDPFDHEPAIDAAVAHLTSPTAFALAIAVVALGAAQGALDDIVTRAPRTQPLLSATALAAIPTFHVALACADTALRAARALTYELADMVWVAAEASRDLTVEQRARLRAGAVWSTEQAVAIVAAAHRAGGGDSVYRSNPLQRRLRDVNTITQHFLVRPDTMATAGSVLAGNPLDVPVF